VTQISRPTPKGPNSTEFFNIYIPNSDPTPLTAEIEEAVREKLAEDIEAITEDYHGELSSCRTTKGLSYSLND